MSGSVYEGWEAKLCARPACAALATCGHLCYFHAAQEARWRHFPAGRPNDGSEPGNNSPFARVARRYAEPLVLPEWE